MATRGPGHLRDTTEPALAEHSDRECPACGQTYDREDGEVPSAPGYMLDHCPDCAEAIERRAVREANRRAG